jgi:hypothetical protein
MRAKNPFVPMLVLCVAGAAAAAQDLPAPEAPQPPEPLFVLLSVWPTASLSRYDYNNDVDFYEMRLMVELRRGSQEGPSIPDAILTSLGERLDYVEDHYEKRIPLDKGRLPSELEVDIAVKGRVVLKERFPLPAWLVLAEPRPAIIDPAGDLTVRWRYDRFPAPVDIHAYDFKTGKEFYHGEHLEGPAVVIAAPSLPRAAIIRIYVIQSWLYKRFLGGPDYARGSEVNVIPWSQVFVRTK